MTTPEKSEGMDLTKRAASDETPLPAVVETSSSAVAAREEYRRKEC